MFKKKISGPVWQRDDCRPRFAEFDRGRHLLTLSEGRMRGLSWQTDL